ncbi:MAG: GPW/gp25 family protein [Lachnospiraceae bacterium]|nr:GPW/gp25 family protein [Lachnospiraceae bacterium]
MAQEFLGSGMKFPPRINPATGRFEVSKGETSIKESVYIILMTQKSERWIRPEFGSSLTNYTFMDTSSTMLNVMAREVASDLMSQEPRLSDVNVRIDSTSKQGCLIIYIDYLIRETNVRDNLVFPFYLDTTWEDAEEELYFDE